jgi:hypothetical protein
VSDDDDNDFIRQAAAEYVQAHGPAAVDWLEEHAELADSLEDYDSADTSREIAAAARSILASTSR